MDQYLDFYSYYPLTHKVAMAHTLTRAAGFVLCISLPGILKKDRSLKPSATGYPIGLVKRNWHPIYTLSCPCPWTRAPKTMHSGHPICTSGTYQNHSDGLWPRYKYILAINHTTPWGRHWLIWRTASPYSKSPRWSKGSPVVYAPRCTCMGQTGRTLGHCLKELQGLWQVETWHSLQ